MRRYVYASCMGGIYRLTRSDWRYLLSVRSEGKSFDLTEIGTYLGQIEDVTDLTPEEAKEKLNER